MRRRHIALLTYCYPPAKIVGAIRPANVAAALQRAGWEVSVITARIAEDEGRARPCVHADRVVTVPVLPNLASRIAHRVPSRLRGSRGGSRQTSEGSPNGQAEGIVGTSRRWLLSLLQAPDENRGFIRPAARALAELHRDRPIDLIYSTAPPWSAHLAALTASRAVAVPWIAEFRDPWDVTLRPPEVRSALADSMSNWLARRVVRRATRVVAVTPSTGRELTRQRARLGHADGAVVALNGIAWHASVGPARTGPIRVLHAGDLYLKRDPAPFFEALAGGIRAGRLAATDLELVFMGAGAGGSGAHAVEPLAARHGLAGAVRIVPAQPLEVARRQMAEADVLLLLAQAQPTQVPNKLYDYLGARRPIIAYVDREGESAAILESVGGHCLVPADAPEEGAGQVVELLGRGRELASGEGMNEAALDALATERQLEVVVDAIRAILP